MAEQDCQWILDSGFDDLWAKPISLGEILERAAAYLGSPSKQSPPPSTGGIASASTVVTDPRLEATIAEFVRGFSTRYRH